MKRPPELRSKQPLLWSTGTGVDVWAMFRAARDGDIPALRRLAQERPVADPLPLLLPDTPLFRRAREPDLQAVKLLLDHMGDPLSLAVNDTLLEVARHRGYREMEQLLERWLSERFRVSARGEAVGDGNSREEYPEGTPAARCGAGARALGDERGNQPIHWAVMTRQLKMIDEVLDRGADINARRFDGARPMQLTNGDYLFRGWRDVSSKTRPRQILDYLRKRGADCDICTACYIGDIDRVRELLGQDAGLANRPSDYVTYYACSGTPLRNAAAGGHIEIVRLLLDNGADPNLPEEGIAPRGHALHSAVCNGHREIVELLLERGAYPNVPVESSADTLSAAMRNGDKPMVELLASHGAARSLELLAYYGDVVTAAAMLSANPKLANDPQALAYAAEEGQSRSSGCYCVFDRDWQSKWP